MKRYTAHHLIRLKPEQLDAWKLEAERRKMTLSGLFRQAMENYLHPLHDDRPRSDSHELRQALAALHQQVVELQATIMDRASPFGRFEGSLQERILSYLDHPHTELELADILGESPDFIWAVLSFLKNTGFVKLLSDGKWIRINKTV